VVDDDFDGVSQGGLEFSHEEGRLLELFEVVLGPRALKFLVNLFIVLLDCKGNIVEVDCSLG
jgi:hypothetical protein